MRRSLPSSTLNAFAGEDTKRAKTLPALSVTEAR